MKPGYEQLRNDREINLLIEQGNRNLKVLGESGGEGRKDPEGTGVSETTCGYGKDCRLYA